MKYAIIKMLKSWNFFMENIDNNENSLIEQEKNQETEAQDEEKIPFDNEIYHFRAGILMKIKHIFKKTKISQEYIVQISFIMIFIIIDIIIPVMINKYCSSSDYYSDSDYKNAISGLNLVIFTDYKSGASKISEINTVDELAQIFVRGHNLIRTNNISNSNYDKGIISEKELKVYQNFPCFETSDKKFFAITKFEAGCKNVDMKNPENSSCIIEVDLNGKDKPNQMSEEKNFKDRHQLIIDGNNNKVLPVESDLFLFKV